MSERHIRKRIAAETIQILDQGYYYHPNCKRISIRDIVNQSVSETRLFSPAELDYLQTTTSITNKTSKQPAVIDVTEETTLQAASRLQGMDQTVRWVCLNFASAKNPGGGFLGGSQAQEESLARASSLYASLVQADGFYRANKDCRSSIYTDHIIYSPDVVVFRDHKDKLLRKPYLLSFITVPAVNAGAVRKNEAKNISKINSVMVERIEKILRVALYYQHTHIILGAWGCGVFKNDPQDVAGYFQYHLAGNGQFICCFDHIVFAIKDNSWEKQVLGAFKEMLL